MVGRLEGRGFPFTSLVVVHFLFVHFLLHP